MNMSKCNIALAAVALLCIGMVGSTWGDVFIRQTTHTDEYVMAGDKHPAENDTSSVWLSEDKASMMMSDGQTFIVRADEDVIYVVDNKAKAYAEMSMDAMENMKAMMGGSGEEGAEATAMMEGMMEQMMASIKVKVTPTEETKKIGKWDTKKYEVEATLPMGTSKSTMWVNEDAMDDVKMYHKVTNVMMMSMPGFEKILNEFEKIKGMPIMTSSEINAMGTVIKSTSEILEYSKEDAPDGTYELPKDYAKKNISDILGK